MHVRYKRGRLIDRLTNVCTDKYTAENHTVCKDTHTVKCCIIVSLHMLHSEKPYQ